MMKKRMFSLLAVLVLCVCLVLPAFAAEDSHPPRLVDEVGLLSAQESTRVLTRLNAVSAENDFDVAIILMPADEVGYDTKAYADWLATVGRPVVQTGLVPVLKSMREKYESTVRTEHDTRVIVLRRIEANDAVVLFRPPSDGTDGGLVAGALIDCLETDGRAALKAVDVRTTSCIENVLSGSLDELKVRLMVMDLVAGCVAAIRLVEKSNPSRTLDITLSPTSRAETHDLVMRGIRNLLAGRAVGARRNRYDGPVAI